MDLLQQKPYTFKRASYIFQTYQIVFEETPIREVVGYDNAESLTRLLNSAWRLGAGSGYIVGQSTQ